MIYLLGKEFGGREIGIGSALLYNIAPFKDKIKLVIGDITNYQHLVQELIDVDFIVTLMSANGNRVPPPPLSPVPV
mgnify:CR=1 FL=1